MCFTNTLNKLAADSYEEMQHQTQVILSSQICIRKQSYITRVCF